MAFKLYGEPGREQPKLLVGLLVGIFESRISEIPQELLEKELISSEDAAKVRHESSDHELSSIEKAIALANGVSSFIEDDVSKLKFSILMEYLNESLPNSPTDVSLLVDTFMKMEEDIHCKVSTLQGMRKEVMSNHKVDSEHDVKVGDDANKTKVHMDDKSTKVADDEDTVVKMSPAEKEARKNLEQSQRKIKILENRKRALKDEIKKLNKRNTKILSQKKKELRQIELELEKERAKSDGYKRDLSLAKKNALLEDKTKLLAEKDEKLVEIKSHTETMLQKYLDKITNLKEEIEALKVRLQPH